MPKNLYTYKAFYNGKEWTSRSFTNKHKLFNHLESKLTNKNKAINLTDKIVITVTDAPYIAPKLYTKKCATCNNNFEVTSRHRSSHHVCLPCWRKQAPDRKKGIYGSI